MTGKIAGLEERVPMCGIPNHSYAGYLDKLVEKGYKVAICEQTEDPKMAKGIVKREIVRVITPGTITIPDAIDETTNNFIVCLLKEGASFGFVAADASTGELYATEFTSESAKSDVLNEIAKFLAPYHENIKVELIPYNRMTGAKYKSVGRNYNPEFNENATLNKNTEIFKSYGISCVAY